MSLSFPAVPGATGRPLDQVRLTGLRARGHHGVFEHERREGQEFVVDVELAVDLAPAGASDDLADTVPVGESTLQVIHLVGHTPGSIALLYDDPDGTSHIFTGEQAVAGEDVRCAVRAAA